MICCHRFAVVVTILALAVACTSRNDPHAGTETGDDNAVVDAIFASWDVRGSPGCALAVARDGILVYSRGYGYANLDYDIPITPQTVFDVASITKQFNAASLTMLALEGKLSLEDDVRKWLPELPEYDSPITLQHMIYHTSGLRDYLNLFPLAGRGDYYPISHAQILAMMVRQRALIFPPGDQYRYSNTAYMLLAQVLERAGGKSLGEMTRERIFEPLGMEGSLMYTTSKKLSRGAQSATIATKMAAFGSCTTTTSTSSVTGNSTRRWRICCAGITTCTAPRSRRFIRRC
jgi:CubicO group peptidase (beta-lactamase class C family)